MAYSVVKSVLWLLGRIYVVYCGEECGVAVRENTLYIL